MICEFRKNIQRDKLIKYAFTELSFNILFKFLLVNKYW